MQRQHDFVAGSRSASIVSKASHREDSSPRVAWPRYALNKIVAISLCCVATHPQAARSAPIEDIWYVNDGSPKGVQNVSKRPGLLPRGARERGLRTDLPRDFALARALPHFDYYEWNLVASGMREGYLSEAVAYAEHFVDRDPERALQGYAWIQKARYADAAVCNKPPEEVDAWVNALSPGLMQKLASLATRKPAHYYRGLRDVVNRADAGRREYMFLCDEPDLRHGQIFLTYLEGTDVLRGIMGALGVKDPNRIEATELPLPSVEAPESIRWAAPIAWLDDDEIVVRKSPWMSKEVSRDFAAPSHSPPSFAIWSWRTGEVRPIATAINLEHTRCSQRGELVVRVDNPREPTTIWKWTRQGESVVWAESKALAERQGAQVVEINPIDCSVLPVSRSRRGLYEWPLPDKSGSLVFSTNEVGWRYCEGTEGRTCVDLEAGRTEALGTVKSVSWLDAIVFIESAIGHIHPTSVAIWRRGAPIVRLDLPTMHYLFGGISVAPSKIGLIGTISIVGAYGKYAYDESGVYRVVGEGLEKIRQGGAMIYGARFQVSPDGCQIIDQPRHGIGSAADLPLAVIRACFSERHE